MAFALVMTRGTYAARNIYPRYPWGYRQGKGTHIRGHSNTISNDTVVLVMELNLTCDLFACESYGDFDEPRNQLPSTAPQAHWILDFHCILYNPGVSV